MGGPATPPHSHPLAGLRAGMLEIPGQRGEGLESIGGCWGGSSAMGCQRSPAQQAPCHRPAPARMR